MSNPNAVWPRHNGRIRSKQIMPALEATPDINRGEQRLAAEFALARMRGEEVPGCAQGRAFNTLTVLATG